jgi:hypothetical protein
MNLAEMESFYADQFGRETVRGIAAWNTLLGTDRIALVASRGEMKVMYGAQLLESLDQLHPYQLDRLAGEPVALIPVDAAQQGGEMVLVTDAGSVVRLRPDTLITGTQRAIRLRKDERVAAAFNLDRPGDLLLAESNGRGKRLHTRSIPFSDSPDLGTRTLSRRALSAAMPLGSAQTGDLWAITTRRLIPLDLETIPLDPPTPPNSRDLVRLRKGESLLALQFLS